MVYDSKDFTLLKVVEALGLIAVVHQEDLLPRGVGHDLRGLKTEFFQNKLALRVYFSLGHGFGLYAELALKVSQRNRRADGVRVRVFVSYYNRRHL